MQRRILPARPVFNAFLTTLFLALFGCSDPEPPAAPASQAAPESAEAPPATTPANGAEGIPVARLPDGVRPLRYDLHFTIVPAESHFSGEARITVELDGPHDHLWLHGLDLDVSRAALVPTQGEPIPGRFEIVDPFGVARLDLESTAPAGTATIEIDYRAPFNLKLAGLYKVEEGGNAYAFSQMEAIDARRAFPGFDEPRFKTPYSVRITTRSEDEAFTNARAIDTVDAGDGLKTITYAETPPLPTYLIAFTVGPVDVVEWEPVPASEVRPHPLPLRGITARGKGEQIRFALEHTAGILTTLEDYFGIAYPYDKLDIVAAPDFRAGAMENAGLILYREWLLLMDDTAPLAQQRAYASVHAHELAHQWFGNLVTMPWWDDIWLNEAFATWMGHKAVDEWRPDYLYDRRMQERALSAMKNDSLLSARQIREPVPHNADIENAFDGITYSKGGGVLSMFETWLGEATFREGVRAHMQRFAHGNATVFDFIQSLSAVAPDKSVDAAFRSFLFQPGVPFVQVALDCEGENATVRLRQERYLPWGTEETEPHRWTVPVCMSYGVDDQVREECVLLDAPELSVELGSALTCPDWVMPNRNGAGYYRFALDGDDMKALTAAAGEHLSAREKVALADSLEAAMRNGSLPSEAFLGAVPDLASARERSVVTAPLATLAQVVQDFLAPGPTRERAKAWLQSVYGQRLARLEGPDGAESDMERELLRQELLEFLALTAEDPGIRAELAAAGRAYLGWGGDGALHPEALDPALLETALSVAGEEADAPFFEHMVEHLKASDQSTTRNALVAGLARVRDPDLMDRSLALAVDPILRVNEMPSMIFGAMVHFRRDHTWVWIENHLDEVLARLPERYGAAAPRLGSGFCDREHAERLQALFEPRLEALRGADLILAQSLESIEQCQAVRERQSAGIERFFAETGGEAR